MAVASTAVLCYQVAVVTTPRGFAIEWQYARIDELAIARHPHRTPPHRVDSSVDLRPAIDGMIDEAFICAWCTATRLARSNAIHPITPSTPMMPYAVL